MGQAGELSVLEAIRRRASADDFDPDRELDEGAIRELIAAATRAPSSFNIQHWRFVAVRSPEDKQRLRQAAYGQRQVGEAAVTFIVLGDLRGVDRLPQIMESAEAQGAIPAGKAEAWVRMAREIYADERISRDEAVRSGALAAMLLMLAAEARGLVSLALAGFDARRAAAAFGIPDRYLPVMLLAVGYPLPGTTRKPMPRLDSDDVLFFDRWPDP